MTDQLTQKQREALEALGDLEDRAWTRPGKEDKDAMKSSYRALRTYILNSTPPEVWQSVESAPCDGTKLLLARWCDLDECWRYEVAPYSNLDVARRGEGYLHGRATHWMPLPAAPTPEDHSD